MKSARKTGKARSGLVAIAAVLATAALPAGAAASEAAPAFGLTSMALPSNFAPGAEAGEARYEAFVSNQGAVATDGSPITIVDTLPAGLAVERVRLRLLTAGFALPPDFGEAACETAVEGEVSTVTCTIDEALPGASEPATLHPDEQILFAVEVTVPEALAGTLANRVEVSGGGVKEPAVFEAENEVGEADAPAGLQYYRAEALDLDGEPIGRAGSHPNAYVTSFATEAMTGIGAEVPFIAAGGDVKDIEVRLPPGLVGAPTALDRCSRQQFNTNFGEEVEGLLFTRNACPDSAAVGLITVQILDGKSNYLVRPIYNMEPPPGMPAQLGFSVLGAPFFIDTSLRSEGDYGISAHLRNTTEAKRVMAATVTIWGEPAAPHHDRWRGGCAGPLVGEGCPFEGDERPFLRLPTSCSAPISGSMSFDSWLHQGVFATATFAEAAPTDCEAPDFSPAIEARPTTSAADSPSGLDFNLHLPQREHEDPGGVGEADLRDAVVTLPAGMVVNPSSANGLGACSQTEIGYTGSAEGRPAFDAEPARCPDAAKIATAQVSTPLLDHPLPGAVYLAEPHANPFGSLLAIYIAIEDPASGIVVKLAGEVSADPETGRLTTAVRQSPQLPFEDFRLRFFSGAAAPLRTPPVCGLHTTGSELVPWSAPAGLTAHPADSFQIAQSPAGGCAGSAAELPSAPQFEAGSESALAATYSPIVLRLARGDATQEFSRLTLTPPEGLLARLAGIPYCPEAALAAAASRDGAEEQTAPSCPQDSRVGEVTVGAGAGPAPYHARGTAYLAGPYGGAPLSLAVITPALAGPFDLGTVVVRSALHVDPVSTQITAVTDPIPTILAGIPLDVRSIALRLDHPGWGLNPSSCAPASFAGELLSAQGKASPLSSRFQVGECARLGFKPKLALRLTGGTGRGAFPALRATYKPRPGRDANLEDLVLRLPRSEYIEQGHFGTICTRTQWAAGPGGGADCPKGSIYGRVHASTPLLDEPLRGPVYLRSSSHNLPDVVFALRGQVSAEVAVRIDSLKGGLRASVEGAPDVPLEKVVVQMRGGRKGLLINSRDVCARPYRAHAPLAAHNGRRALLRPLLRNGRCAKAKKRGGRGKGRRR